MRYYDETMTDFDSWTAVRTALEPGAQALEDELDDVEDDEEPWPGTWRTG